MRRAAEAASTEPDVYNDGVQHQRDGRHDDRQRKPPSPHSRGRRRQSALRSRRRTENNHLRRPGDHMTVPRASHAECMAATREARTAKGAGERPAVILVRTKPGRTICTETPVPRRASHRPWAKPSTPAFGPSVRVDCDGVGGHRRDVGQPVKRVPTPHKDAMCRRCAGLVCRGGV